MMTMFAEQLTRVFAMPAEASLRRNATWTLLATHASVTWTARSIEWSAALFLTFVYPDSLLPVSVFALACSTASVIATPLVTRTLDTLGRFPTLSLALAVQKAAIALICVLLWSKAGFSLHSDAGNLPPVEFRADAAFVFTVLGGCVLTLANALAATSVERDWALVVARSVDEPLAVLNSQLRRIDLFCKTVASLAISGIAAASSVQIAMLVVAGQGLLTVGVEMALLSYLVRIVPAISVGRQASSPSSAAPADPIDLGSNGHAHEREQQQEPLPSVDAHSDLQGKAVEVPVDTEPSTESTAAAQQQEEPTRTSLSRTLAQIVRHPVFPTILAIAQLYFTVLSFGPVMISYLLNRGYSAPVLAALRGLSIMAGLTATVTTSPLIGRIGPVRTGLWAIWSQVLSLVPVIVSFWVPSSTAVNGILLFGGTTLSRWGLWTFDLSQMQIFQESVAETEIGLMSGVQISLQSAFDMLGYVTTIIWFSPSSFWIPAHISIAAVFCGALTFTFYAKRVRGHLFHPDRIPLLRSIH
ncbi:Ferroporti-1 [Entophlyctis helioformis]|nr:Ferroporti-1 [Entophlyctis helioformis]